MNLRMPLQLSQQLSQRHGLKHQGHQRRFGPARTSAVSRRVNGGVPKLLSGSRTRGVSLVPFKAPDERTIVPQASFLESLTSKLRPKPKPEPKKAQAKTVFVAGSTGRVGARIVRELLAQGYTVRAGARNVEGAQEAIDVAEAYGLLTGDMMKRVEVVPFDITKTDSIREAIGGAQSVVCAVGAPENDALNPLAPKAIDGDGTISLIKESAAAGVERFVLITSLGTEKVGWPASILNLFWGVLIWKREAEKALENSGMAYTILRPGGMERPTDSYKETHNLKLSPKNTTFGGQVSRLQVAELVGAVLNNPELSTNKVLEVTAETTAPRLSLEELLQGAAGIKADVSPEKQKATQEASKGAAAAVSTGDKRLAAAREDLELAMDRIQAANASLAEAKDLEAEANQPLSPQQLNAVRQQVANQLRGAAAPAPKVAPAAPAAKQAPPAAPKAAPKAAPAPAPTPQPAAAAAAPKAAPAPAPKPAPAPAPKKQAQPNFFQKLFGGGETVELDVGAGSDSQKIRVPQKGEESVEPPQEAPAAPKAAPAAAAPKAAPAAAAPKAAPAAAAPKAAPAAAAAKAAPAAAAAAAKAAPAPAAPEQPPAEAPPQPAPAAAAPPPPPAPKKPTVPVESAEEVEARMLAAIAEEKRQKAIAGEACRGRGMHWIANWQVKQGKPVTTAPDGNGAPAPAATGAAANKKDAQEWIARWQAKQKQKA
ncbi:hypothetical protein DUNSADRAFT_7821 [Dunaliella salina]|uniref:NAD(P)-binding domain-containing protein n=1 Tax=Dunaliella salina TaxID=3046 RepID=A0ABQ7GKJ8_DUNSA|nr:hypothetical protein DUNSADRAFT_7821 [Dunaliella salina]|eukprot:KAF5835146.1 hypothetical protein DUNSADRAFT_7821 [Dunaliella salina]